MRKIQGLTTLLDKNTSEDLTEVMNGFLRKIVEREVSGAMKSLIQVHPNLPMKETHASVTKRVTGAVTSRLAGEVVTLPFLQLAFRVFEENKTA